LDISGGEKGIKALEVIEKDIGKKLINYKDILSYFFLKMFNNFILL
jgi:hypothetical protein